MSVTSQIKDITSPNEPVKANLYPVGALVAVATFLGILGAAQEATWQLFCLAGSAALGQFVAIVYAVNRARDKAWGPQTVNEIMDADAVIKAAESVTDPRAGA